MVVARSYQGVVQGNLNLAGSLPQVVGYPVVVERFQWAVNCFVVVDRCMSDVALLEEKIFLIIYNNHFFSPNGPKGGIKGNLRDYVLEHVETQSVTRVHWFMGSYPTWSNCLV